MRMNLPVTNEEFHIADGKSIVSKTDLKGNITYVNPYFIEASGFTEEELIGAPQNIIRHPDMPAEAFKDLWRTIKAGIPWTGYVKNRRKNGGFYWVVANITPIRENGKVIGYMSVRIRPNKKDVAEVEKLYTDIRKGQSKFQIHEGEAIKKGLGSLINQLTKTTLSMRIHFSMLLIVLLQLLMTVLGFTLHQNILAGVGLFSTAICALFWFTLIHIFIRPIRQAVDAANAMTAGDLSTIKVDSRQRHEIGRLLRSLRQMSINLASVIWDVKSNAESINTTTNEIATGNMDLSKRTESQASNLEETASSMEEISSTVKNNAQSVLQANSLVQNASSVAQKGGEIAAHAGQTMKEINESSQKVVDIIGLIDSIAFQTNILALNAAVEAARAGEQGRGFAVVASEVRNLAQRSANAAKEIKAMIENSADKIAIGTEYVQKTQTSMHEIVDSVTRVTNIMNEITVANKEQSEGVNLVHQAITQIDNTTQQNAALVEQSAAASESLNHQTRKLLQAVSVFKF